MSESSGGSLRLNLGSGQNPMPGFVNVDKFGSPDVRWDLEQLPWPWETGSVDEVFLIHVLEHLGETTATYFGIIRELYRVCKPGATVVVRVPHPRHDDFLNDPTHVRAVTVDSLALFSKKLNRQWAEEKSANSPLALYVDVDFEITRAQVDLDPTWLARLQSGELTEQQVLDAARQYNNVIKQTTIILRVAK